VVNTITHSNSLIIIPCYNHGKHLEVLLRNIHWQLPNWNIVLVDDGSTDDSSLTTVPSGCHILRHPENLGKGAALWTGIQWGLQKGKDWFLFMDADEQHPPESIPAFLDMMEDSGNTFIIGNRLGDMSNMPFHRRLSNRLTSWILSKKIKHNIPDSQCGFRLVHRTCLEGFRPKTRHYETETELLLYAAQKGARIGSVTIPTIYQGQRSSIRNVRDTCRFIRLICTGKKGVM
jgi:glycosyltransferase involved in cell wall biosynthesis